MSGFVIEFGLQVRKIFSADPSLMETWNILEKLPPSIPNYNLVDFFDPKFDHSFYSKKLCKHSSNLSHSCELLLK